MAGIDPAAIGWFNRSIAASESNQWSAQFSDEALVKGMQRKGVVIDRGCVSSTRVMRNSPGSM